MRRLLARLPLLLIALGSGCRQPSGQRAVEIAKLQGDLARGQRLFVGRCAVCHGSMGEGTDAGVALATHFAEHQVEELALILIDGTELMPPQPQLSNQELADVIAYGRAEIAKP